MGRTIPYLEKGGLGVRLWYAPGGGHTYRGEVGPLVEQAVSWLVEGEPRFADLVAPR